MLATKLAHGLVELPDVAEVFAGAFPFEMDDGRPGEIVIFIPGFFYPETQVDVLGIEEELLIKAPYFRQNGPADPETGAREDRRRMGLVRRQPSQVIPGEQPVVGEKGRKTGQAAKACPGGRKAPAGLFQETAAAIDHPDSEAADAGGRRQEGETAGDAVFREDRVGVEEEDILSAGLFQGLVIRPAKSLVLLVGQELNPGKPGLQIVAAAVPRVVVDDDDLGIETPDRFLHGMEAELEEILYLVIDDDDGQCHGLAK